MRSHEIDYEILGDDMQLVEVELDPKETIVAEAGAMNYLEQDIEFATRMGDGSEAESGVFGKLLSAGKRAITGESVFLTHFTNTGTQKRRAAFAGPYPGKIIAIDLSRIPAHRLQSEGCESTAAGGFGIIPPARTRARSRDASALSVTRSFFSISFSCHITSAGRL